jgi:mannose-6-phosphate isomerase-like protein (cupin superfamily)
MKGWKKMYYIPYGYPYPAPYYVPTYTNLGNPQSPDMRWGYWQAEKLKVRVQFNDYGPNPFVVDIEAASEQNKNYRTALWTGEHLQVTVMSIPVGGDIGLEVHHDTDQFLRIEEGKGIVRMGKSQNNLSFERRVREDSAIMVPAGTWHNVINTGSEPIKLYTIYAPPHHPHGTVQRTKAEAMA